jgi:hypothetical protein
MSGSGMTAGVITVIGDGTYTIVPTKGPFGVVATSTSLAQAIFEQIYPLLLNVNTFPLATQAQIVDATTTPPTTAKGRALQNLAAQHNHLAAAIVGYVQANAVAHVTSQSLGAMPSSTSAGTPIAAPASPVNVPIL